ncbi:hypothetical protein U1Q18_014732, partial [Sarracenia purpurea var. burkii]
MEASSSSQSLEEITSPSRGMREGWLSKASGSQGLYHGFGEDEKVDEVADDGDKGEEVYMFDLMVRKAEYEVGIANQKLKNAMEVRAYQNPFKGRVVGK